MKLFTRKFVLVASAAILSLPPLSLRLAACPQCQAWGPFYRELNEGMAEMAAAMKAADEAFIGDPDSDFLRLMIPHHRGAIAMAKAVLLRTSDPALKNMALEIIAEQQVEITAMEKMSARLQATGRKQSAGISDAADDEGVRNGFRRVANPVVTPAPAEKPVSARPASGVPSAEDRVYTADQISNTVSVIDPATSQLLGLIKLGDPVPAALSPLYKGQSLVHGLGFAPDGSRLAVISIGSNSISLIETSTNKVLKSRYLGRAPHEAFFRPDGKEIWVAIRGEDYVEVLDAVTLDELARIPTNPGPGMILFRPDGKYAFVPSSFTPELCVIEVATRQVAARVPQASPFSPNLAVSADGREVWFTLKDAGKTQVMSAEPPFAILHTIDSGPITNHVSLVDGIKGKFAYVTVGGTDEVKVYRRDPPYEQVAAIVTGALPHGIWPSPDGTKVYVGLENAAQVAVIETTSNKVVATIPTGQLPQALVYVPHAVRGGGDGKANLLPLAALKSARVVQMRPHDRKLAARASVTVVSLGVIDQVQIAASGLVPGQEYELVLVDAPEQGHFRSPLAKMKASPAGTAIAQTLGPVRTPESSAPAENVKVAAYALVLEPSDPKAAVALFETEN